jgi:hypothetical protein
MSGNAIKLKRSGRFTSPASAGPVTLKPRKFTEIARALGPDSRYAPPFRPVGANTSATDCTSSTVGTVIDLSGMGRILQIDAANEIVTVEPGVRIGDLVSELASHGLELAAGHDIVNRTVGGAVAGGCLGPVFGDDRAYLASQVESLSVITPNGKPIRIRPDQHNLLHAFRLSYGMLGVLYEIRLRVQPIRTFTVSHRRCTFDQFAAVTERLANTDIGLKFFLLPFRNRVYLDIRRRCTGTTGSYRIPWRLKDWGESTVLPNVFKSLNRVVPVDGIRYRLIDEISQFTQGIVNNRLVMSGSNSTAMSSRRAAPFHYSTWLFPAAEFSIVVQAYREFCLNTRATSGFRCDMPTVGFRVGRDSSALLSPSFEQPMIALRALTTQSKGWDDFVIDFADFARRWGGVPLFNQTREVPYDYPRQVFGSRCDFFRSVRRRFDPDNRMMNPFLSQYFL